MMLSKHVVTCRVFMLGVPGPKVVKNLLLLLGAAWSAQQLRHVIDEDGLEVRSVTSTKVTRDDRH